MNPIIEEYMMLVEKISHTSKSYKQYGTDVNIYRSEIHIVQIIGDRGKIHQSEIARLIGITKGTVSQVVKRLEAKGLVEKIIDEENNTRLLLSLTDKGVVAYKSHDNYHKTKHCEMESFIESLNDGEQALLKKFLTKAYEIVDDHF